MGIVIISAHGVAMIGIQSDGKYTKGMGGYAKIVELSVLANGIQVQMITTE